MSQTSIEDSRYKRMPTPEELRAMERDLQFHPADALGPAALTPEQAEQYNLRGYVKGINIFSEAESSEIRKGVDTLIAAALAKGQSSYSIISAHLKSGLVHDIMNDRRIVAYINDIIGEDVVGWGSHFFCKLPHDTKTVAWHQDASYWPLSPSKTVTAWLAIDDTDTENACMRFISGSHTQGHIGYRASDDAEQNVLNQTVDDVTGYGDPVDIELEAGQISLHSDLLLHGSEANSSARRRCGLTLRYCASSVRAQLGWNAEGVWVAGSDPTGHWANNPRPLVDNV
jgi:non-haem Fe2+, alpha-ketoglutarate-dependent halogenase